MNSALQQADPPWVGLGERSARRPKERRVDVWLCAIDRAVVSQLRDQRPAVEPWSAGLALELVAPEFESIVCSAHADPECAGRGAFDTAEAMRHSMTRGLPDLVGYLSNQMQAERLRRMDPVLAIQLLAGPIVVHLFTRPLAGPLIGSQTPKELLEEIVRAWLRAMAPERGPCRG